MMLAAGLQATARPTLRKPFQQTYAYDDRSAGRGDATTASSVALKRRSGSYSGHVAAFHVYDHPRRQVSCTFRKFTAKERDGETGLDYFGARYMSSAQGRFTSPDPIWVKADRLVDPQRLNLYAYGRNNPLRFTDPTGMDIEIGKCAIGTAQDCFNRFQQGLRKEDRSAGDGRRQERL